MLETFNLDYRGTWYQGIKLIWICSGKYVLHKISAMLAWFWLGCFYSQTWSHSVLRLKTRGGWKHPVLELLEAKKWRGFVPGEIAWVNAEWKSIWNALRMMNSSLTELWEQMLSKKKKKIIHEYSVDLQISLLKEDKRKIESYSLLV